jgi:hypothetical protein
MFVVCVCLGAAAVQTLLDKVSDNVCKIIHVIQACDMKG